MFNFNFDASEQMKEWLGIEDYEVSEETRRLFEKTLVVVYDKLATLNIDVSRFANSEVKVVILSMEDLTEFKAGFTVIDNMPWVFFDHVTWDAVLHELIHVVQYLEGRFDVQVDVNTQTTKFYWEGEEYQYSDKASFLNAPWEKEAYHLQTSLYDEEEMAAFNAMKNEFLTV